MTTQTSDTAANPDADPDTGLGAGTRGGNWWDGMVAVHDFSPQAAARRVLIDACGPKRSADADGRPLPDQELLRRARLATHPDRPEHRDGTALDRVLDAALALDLIKKPDRANQIP